jgi:hypothetical protein
MKVFGEKLFGFLVGLLIFAFIVAPPAYYLWTLYKKYGDTVVASVKGAADSKVDVSDVAKTGSKTASQIGGGSDWAGSFYARTVEGGPAKLTEVTLSHITEAPMFNPLSDTAVIPTEATGIVPTGLYLAELQQVELEAERDLKVQETEASRAPVIAA